MQFDSCGTFTSVLRNPDRAVIQHCSAFIQERKLARTMLTTIRAVVQYALYAFAFGESMNLECAK